MSDKPTLTQVMNALQDIGQAVTADDLDGYREAVRRAREIEITDEQIQDAYDYRSRLRLRQGYDPISFAADGERKA